MAGFIVVVTLGAILGAELYFMFKKEEKRIAEEEQAKSEKGCCSCGCCKCNKEEE